MKKPAGKAAPALSAREREIMNAVFALENRASAEEVRARLTNPPGDSAVRVMLARLEKKGCLKHRQEGQRFIYSATTPPAMANPLASALDHADWPEVTGTIAGDDTVLVVAPDAKTAQELQVKLAEFLR